MIGSRQHRAVQESRFWQAYDRHRYAILFYALLLTLVLLPVAASLGLPAILIKLLLGTCLIAAAMPNSMLRTRMLFLITLVLLVMIREASESGFLPVRPALILVLIGLTGLAAAAATFRFTIIGRSVTHETVYAALSTYLLAGLFFGQIYWSIESIRPGSIEGPDPISEVTAVYYSFVTLATLGYGDFVPRTDVARGVAMFEVMGGQLFLAVLVARLIGGFGERKRDP